MLYNKITDKLFNDNTNIKVIHFLSMHEKGISGRSLAQLGGVSTFKMHHVLKFLTDQGLLSFSVVGKANIYKLNQEHTLYKELIKPIIHYQKNIYQKLGQNIANTLEPKPASIILYGSVARGDETPDSDIDVLLIYNNNDKPEPVSKEVFLFEKITKLYGNQLTIRRSTINLFLEKYKKHDPLISNIIKEGKSIYGMSLMDILSAKDNK